MIVNFLLVIVSILFILSSAALIAYKSGYEEVMGKFETLSERFTESSAENDKLKEIVEGRNYRVTQETVDVRPVSCRIIVPKEIEKKYDYATAIAKDMLWDYAKEAAFYKVEEDYRENATIVEISWFMNKKGERLARDSFFTDS